MFRANPRHMQPALISSISELPEKYRQRLERSWAGTFRREFFLRLHEAPFAALYATVDSRPNTPVNMLVGLDTLKAGFGWSDEELYDHFLYDLQVRYAVGLDSLAEGDFELRTLYNWRRRLSEYNQAHGTNLLTAAFEDITDQQLTALKVRTGMQRMDSTQLASNILDMSRLQLLVEALQRLHRVLSPADQARYAEVFAPYLANKASQYVYHVKGTEARQEHLRRVGQALADVLATLAAGYAQEPIYQVLQRLLAENFRLEAGSPVAKANCEISAGCLQSLDDQEATYRSKAGQPFKGYVANVTKTCDPANTVQLITDVRVAPNTTDDETLLLEAVPQLQARMELDTLYTDGGFTGPQADQTLRERHITHIPSAIRGEPPATDRLHLADFEITQDAQGQPGRLTGRGANGTGHPHAYPAGFCAEFSPAACQDCPLRGAGRCPVEPRRRPPSFRLVFNRAQLDRALRRQRCTAFHRAGHNTAGGGGGHRAQPQASLPGGQAASAGPVPHGLSGGRSGGDDQCPPHPARVRD